MEDIKEKTPSKTEYESGVVRWGEDVKNQAFVLYCRPNKPSMDDISEEIGVSKYTIIQWRDRGKWAQKRTEMYATLHEASYNDAMAEIQKRRRRDLDRMDVVMDISMTAVNDDELSFKDKKQAIDALVAAHKVIESMVEQEIPHALIAEIATIINEEVTDAETRQAIGERILDLGRSWRTR